MAQGPSVRGRTSRTPLTTMSPCAPRPMRAARSVLRAHLPHAGFLRIRQDRAHLVPSLRAKGLHRLPRHVAVEAAGFPNRALLTLRVREHPANLLHLRRRELEPLGHAFDAPRQHAIASLRP